MLLVSEACANEIHCPSGDHAGQTSPALVLGIGARSVPSALARNRPAWMLWKTSPPSLARTEGASSKQSVPCTTICWFPPSLAIFEMPHSKSKTIVALSAVQSKLTTKSELVNRVDSMPPERTCLTMFPRVGLLPPLRKMTAVLAGE